MRQIEPFLFPFPGFFLGTGGGMGRKGTGGHLENRQRSFLNCELENANQVRDQDLDQPWVDAVRQQLIAWYEESQRDFPWRHENDPYRILVSEMMLVQTTAAAVI